MDIDTVMNKVAFKRAVMRHKADMEGRPESSVKIAPAEILSIMFRFYPKIIEKRILQRARYIEDSVILRGVSFQTYKNQATLESDISLGSSINRLAVHVYNSHIESAVDDIHRLNRMSESDSIGVIFNADRILIEELIYFAENDELDRIRREKGLLYG